MTCAAARKDRRCNRKGTSAPGRRRTAGNSLRIGRVLGIELRLDYSWFVIVILVSWSLASQTFSLGHPGWSPARYWLLALATILLFFASVVAHELAHSVVARATGVPVRDITLVVFGGAATLSPESRRPHDEFPIALAGPVASLALAAGFGALWRASGPAGATLHALAGWLAGVNLMLALFNLLPGFPLDGGRAFRALVWGATGDQRRATRIAADRGRIVAFGFIAWGIWQIFAGNWGGGLWIAFIGWFLHNAAAGSEQQTTLEELLAGHAAREVMTACPAIPPRLTLDVLVDQVVVPSGRRCFPVVEEGQLMGLVTLHQIQRVPRERWPGTRAAEIMVGRPDLLTVRVDDELATVFEGMATEGLKQFPVLDGDRLAGMVTRESLLTFVQLRSARAT